MVEKSTQNIDMKKKGKKLDWIIYLLAFISLVLMVVVIVTNNKTDVKVVDIKPIFDTTTEKEKEQKIVKEERFEPEKIEPIIKKDEKEQVKDVKKEKEITEIKDIVRKETEKKEELREKETQKKPEYIVKKDIDKKIVKDGKYIEYKNYNWKALKRYKVKPDKNLYVTSEYIVKSGDALWKIAQKMGVRTINIIAVNPTLSNPNLIFPGQVILIPNM